ncbi:hypothetical protein LEP1GSC039_3416 [Leptospira santarosai str. 2000027870]|nr:hypothetical protein LEP1GSC039_3416 [Leptospira santarosai str. 2000027870]
MHTPSKNTIGSSNESSKIRDSILLFRPFRNLYRINYKFGDTLQMEIEWDCHTSTLALKTGAYQLSRLLKRRSSHILFLWKNEW